MGVGVPILRHVVVAGAILAASAAAGSAADVEALAPYDWSGAYVGAHAGYGSANVDIAALSFIAIIVLISHRKNIREEISRPFAPAKQGPTHPSDEDKS